MAFKVLTILGTRPEALKLAPVISLFMKAKDVQTIVCNTGQHNEMLKQVWDIFDLPIDYNLNVLLEGQSLSQLTAKILENVSELIQEAQPHLVVVQGDTATTFGGALAAYYHKVPIVYVESGLRTQDIYAPFPEEATRKMTTALAALHFAPSLGSEHNLLKEGVPREQIILSGNTVIDTLKMALSRIKIPITLAHLEQKFSYLSIHKKLILVTAHRRENLGSALIEICNAVKALATEKDVQVVFPLHLNPEVQKTVKALLSGHQNIHLIPPLPYLEFIYLMKRAYFLITDSGGVQEEASYLNKPLLVTRKVTEREEVLAHPTESIVGGDENKITEKGRKLLQDVLYYRVMTQARNSYGTGGASETIVRETLHFLERTQQILEPVLIHKKSRFLL